MNLLVETRLRVLHITLQRPEKRNALSADICAGIVNAIDAAQRDHSIGSILIAAAGQVFCSGMDLDEAVDADGPDLGLAHERLFSIGLRSTKPIVVAVNGAALGGGLGLVAQGHIVLAERRSAFALPEIRIGLWPFLVYRAIEHSIGPSRTLALSLTGHSFSSEEALDWGLVHRICPDDEVYACAANVARDIAKASPLAISLGMSCVQQSREKPQSAANTIARELRDELMKSDDFQEGVRAFKQRRGAEWPSMPRDFYSNKPVLR